MEFLLIFISAIFVNNIVLSQFLGICPFLGVSKKIDTALGMGMAVAFVLTLSTIVTYRGVGADCGDRVEESVACAVSGLGHLPSSDNDKLCRSWRCHSRNTEKLYAHAKHRLRLLHSRRFLLGVSGLCRSS